MKKLILSTVLLLAANSFAQNVSIPDANLKNALVNNPAVNSNGDTEIQVTEANNALGSLNLSNLNISNITGLQEFTNVYEIILSNNNLSSVTLTNPSMTITDLVLTGNQLPGGLNLSGLQNLRYLTLTFCDLNAWDPGTVPSLYFVDCTFNNMTTIDFSNNPLLKGISMDACSNLNSITFSPTTNPDLETFSILNTTNLTSDIDLSGFPLLKTVSANGSNISGLNIANGNNSNFLSFGANNTSNLTCVTVDDVAYADANFTIIDANQSFSLDCNAAPPADTVYVNVNATGNNDGSSWNDAYTDARDAFINANDRDQVWIAQGTYIRNSPDRNAVFGWTVDSLKVYGGFSGNGTETSITDRDWDAYPTIFSGDIGVVGDSTDNVYTVFAGPIGALNGGPRITYAYIDGIKVTDGNASGNSYPDYNTVGAGIIVDAYTDHTVWNNIEIYNCYAKQGAAISFWNYQSSQIGTLEMNNFKIHDNVGKSSAGFHIRAHQNASVLATITNSIFFNNHAVEPSSTQGEDLGIVGFFGANSSPFTAEMSNCTFYNNTAHSNTNSKGVIRAYQLNHTGTLEVNNCIFYDNDLIELTNKNWNNVVNQITNLSLNNNILENGHDHTNITENNTLTADPLFTDAANNDFTLQSSSPAIDAGTQTGITPYALDLVGNPRIYGSEIDLGAYEYQGSGGNNGVGIEEENSTALILYPNPTNAKFSIKSNDVIEVVNVYNLAGKLLISEKVNNTLVDINVLDLANGTYLVHSLKSNGTISQSKVQVLH